MQESSKLLTCAVGALTLTTITTPAHAQSEATAGNEARSGLEEVVVTAQRRSQNQQEVPIAVSVFSAEEAATFGSSNTDTLPFSVPGLQLNRESALAITPFLRGVGSSESAGAEGEVAVYIDDVYIGNSSSTDFQFNNVENIEVLRGPQGTLFGRNATGGVLHIHTRNPSHTPSADALVGYGNFDTINGSFYGTTPITDTVAVSFAATGRDQREGYGEQMISGRLTGVDLYKGWSYGFRGKLLWEPSDATEVLISADQSESESDLGGNWFVLPGAMSIGGGTYPGDPYYSYANPRDRQRLSNSRVSAKVTQELGNLDLISITAYQQGRQRFEIDIDFNGDGLDLLSIAARSPTHSFSQELQIQSNKNEAFTWIAGAFYYNSYYCLCDQRLKGAFQAPVGGYRDLTTSVSLDSYSAFADTTVEVLPATRLTAGVRYTSDHYSNHYQYYYPPSPAFPNGSDMGSQPDDSATSSKVTFRAVVDQRLTEDIMAYASFSRGFKSGRFDVSSGNLVEPTNLDAWELGLKSELFDRKVRLNLSGFYYEIDDMQVSHNVGGLNEVVNAASSRIYGLDAEFTFVPTDNWSIVMGAEWLDPKYTSFPGAPFNVANPAVCTPVPATTGPLTGGFTACDFDAKGNTLPQAAKFTMNMAVTYTIPASIGEFALSASIYHNSGFTWEPDNHYRQPSYDLVNAGITWRSPSEKYDIRMYGQNLLDEVYYNGVVSSTLGATASPAMPRNYGAEFAVHF